MRCPYCKEDRDRVIDTRPSEDGHVIRRRRQCEGCGKRYTTHERLETLPLRVVKKDSRRVPFDRKTMLTGILRAVEKRPVSIEQAEDLVDAVESEVLRRFEKEVPSREIGQMVMKRLRDLDEVAYVRFASVYREFKEVDDFLQEVRSIAKQGGKHARDRLGT